MLDPALDFAKYDSDKCRNPSYRGVYEEQLLPFIHRDIRLLELGVRKGGSLLFWRDYFTRGTIIGLDVEPVVLPCGSERIRIYQGQQQDKQLLDRIARESAPDGFDIIIDDCSHIGELARVSFWHLFDHWLKPGGLYVIEDWFTGYWDSWVDGVAYKDRPPVAFNAKLYRLRRAVHRVQDHDLVKRLPLIGSCARAAKKLVNAKLFRSHHNGMVAFIKELVDECASGDITEPGRGMPPHRPSRFANVKIYPSLVVVTKTLECQ